MRGLITPPNHIQSSNDPTSPWVKASYKYVGEVLEFVARAYVLLLTPATAATSQGILHRQTVSLNQIAYDTFDVEILYGRPKTAVGTYTFDFDTTGGTVHITAPKERIARYGIGTETFFPHATAHVRVIDESIDGTNAHIPIHKGAIGVDGDEVKGTDIVAPSLKFNITFKHQAGFVSIPYMKLLHDITGTVNLTKFFGFDPGEILFLGARGSDGSDHEVQITYSFAGSPNQIDDFKIGDIIVSSTYGAHLGDWNPAIDPDIEIDAGTIFPGKRGWDLLWVTYIDNVDETAPGKKAQYVFIDRVYNYVDFASVLGFGGSPS